MLLTYRQFLDVAESDECKALHDRSQPLVAEPWEHVFLGYVPVTWEDRIAHSVEDADDWKEVDIVTTGTKSEALAALRSVFGPEAEIDG